MATLTKKLANEIIKQMLAENVEFDMEIFINIHGRSFTPPEYLDMDRNTVLADCGTACCITGMAMLLDPGVTNLTFREGWTVAEVAGVLVNDTNEVLSPHLYSMRLFGAHHEMVSSADCWPHELAECYRSVEDIYGEIGNRRMMLGTVALSEYCKEFLGFTPRVPRSVRNEVREMVAESNMRWQAVS